MFSEKDTGTRRLLELGIRQKLRRPLHWTHSFMIALSILSPTTCITGKGSSSYQVLYYYSIMTHCALAAARKESLPTGLYSQGLIYGGPVVLVWGWVCAGSLHTLAAFSMSELSSAFPVSGGLYYWSFMLGGNHGPFVSWMVGWINLLGQVCYIMSPRLFAYKHATQPMQHLHVCHCPCTAHLGRPCFCYYSCGMGCWW